MKVEQSVRCKQCGNKFLVPAEAPDTLEAGLVRLGEACLSKGKQYWEWDSGEQALYLKFHKEKMEPPNAPREAVDKALKEMGDAVHEDG